MQHYPEWARVESKEEDTKLLFRFAPRELLIEIKTRRRLGGEWQGIKEFIPLAAFYPEDLAGSIQALIALHLPAAPVPLSPCAGTAIL